MTKTGMTPAMLLAALEGHGVAAGTPDAIELSEAQGQVDLVNSTHLPIKTSPDKETITAETGIVFGEPVDELFVNAALPSGWAKRATDHSMHSDLLDDRGRVRADIFFKAAFYDRRADLRFRAFYTVFSNYDTDAVTITDANDKTVKDFGCAAVSAISRDEFYALQDKATAWLTENYPDYRDPFAYWD